MLHAVIVGIDEYASPIRGLSCAAADANAVKDAIEAAFHPEDLDLTILLNADATRERIMHAIGHRVASAASERDVVFLYFAGHGASELSPTEEVTRYLVPHDAKHQALFSTCIDLDREVVRWMQRVATPRLVVGFFDTCFSGAAGGRTFEGPALARHRTTRSLLPVRRPVRLHDLDLGQGRVVIAACDDHELACEDPALGHGIFTYYLLKSLRRGGGALPTITIASLYDEVARAVHGHSGGKQTPVVNGRDRFARFPFFDPSRA